jgi:hypothetical protein
VTQGVARKGVDEAWSHAATPVLKSLGYAFVCRYLGPDPSKNCTPVEARGILGAGLELVLVYEGAGQRALAGFQAGVTDGALAKAQALAVGQPIDRPVYVAVDFDVQPPQVSDVLAYLRGFALSMGGASRAGVYGGYDIVRAALDAGVVRWAWQTLAWSGGRWDARAQLQQYGSAPVAGVTVDLDRSEFEDFGGWSVDALSQADVDAINAVTIAQTRAVVNELITATDRSTAAIVAAINTAPEPAESATVAQEVTLSPASIAVLAADVAAQVESIIAKKLAS